MYPLAEPKVVVRAPGRVNLIGEHIDYCGMSVLPMAIQKDLMICAGTQPPTNAHQPSILAHSIGYTPSLNTSHPIKEHVINTKQLAWANYFCAGYKGAFEFLHLPSPKANLCFMIQSTVPPGSGLSSSSALIVAVVLATAALLLGPQDLNQIPFIEMCLVAIKSERFVGVNSGGMDQSISLLATKGYAGLVHFKPELRLDLIPIQGAVFVIAHSLVTADKHATAPSQYNLRVLETRLAAVLLAKRLSKSITPTTLSDLVNMSASPKDIMKELQDMEQSAGHLLPNTASETDVAVALGLSVDELCNQFMTEFPVTFKKLKLKDRAMHVFSEAKRVWAFAQWLQELLPMDYDVKCEIGKLMRDSHASCRDLYECSCPELDVLVSVCESAGSLGSRLTGAGFGGCVVSILPSANLVDSFIENLYLNFYQAKGVSREEALSRYVFASEPSQGASVHWVVPN